MKNYKIYFAILLTLIFSTAAFADVKIKSRQTASGQTYENTTYIKGKRQRDERNMGGMRMINLTQCDLKRGVQINEMSKTYMIDLFDQTASGNPNADVKTDGVVRAGGTITMTVTYKDTGETRKMFGYNARRIITTMETVSSADACAKMNSKMEIDGWYIDAAFVLDCQNDRYGSYNYKNEAGCQDKYQTKTIGSGKRGYPVYEKMTMFGEGGSESFSTVTEVIELSQATLDAALFEIPAGYTEVKDSSQLYAMTPTTNTTTSTATGNMPTMPTMPGSGGANTNTTVAPTDIQPAESPNAKKPGTIRIGIMTKTGAVGEGVMAADLAQAVQNTLGEYLKGTKIELIPLQAKLASLVMNEAADKECDYIILANVSHKKGGGGGFGGMFGKAAGGMLGNVIPMAGGTGAAIAGQVASTVVITAANMSSNIKSKDEITLEVKMQKVEGGAAVITKQYKAKAKSDGEDIISTVIEQAAQEIVTKAN